MALEFTTSYLADSLSILRYYKKLGEQAMAQIPDAALTATLDPESNSIAIVVKHLSGNFQARWKDVLASDGEPFRDRDAEFEAGAIDRDAVMAMWEAGWKTLLDALAALSEADLGRTIQIRGERHSVMQAINRATTHCSYHVGQIVFLAKHLAGQRWTSLTIPRGKSKEYHARVVSGEISHR